MEDIFDNRLARPMLIAHQSQPFNSTEYLFELKFDGIRCLAYVSNDSIDFRNKRNKELIHHFPELTDLYRYINCNKCILDGELIVLKNGIPDFYEVQKRTVLTDLFKIKLSSQMSPATFVVYDLIYLNNSLIIDLPLIDRISNLATIITENKKITISKPIENNGIELFNIVKSKELEGVVAKKKSSKYFFEKRSSDWIKFKHLEDDDFVICGYIVKSNSMTSLILGKYNSQDKLIYKGHVTLGVSLRTIKDRLDITDSIPFDTNIPKGNESAVWVIPNRVGIVQYMPSNKEGMRQPVFKGLRDDKSPLECR